MRFLNTGRLYISKRFWELDCKDNGYFKALQSITRLFKLLFWRFLYNLVWVYGFIAIFELKVSEDTKNVIYSTDSCESFKFIHFTGWATKSDDFFSLLFNFIHAKFCRLYSWLILSVQKIIYFDLLYLSFPGSLGCIVCQHYKSLSSYLYLIYYLIWEQDGFVFLAYAEIL